MYATGIKLLKLVKTPLNVALRKTDVTNWLFLRVILISKKKKESFSSNFEVNLMLKRLWVKYQGRILRAIVFQNDVKMHS